MSPNQLKLILNTNIRNIILFYDPDAIKKIKIVGSEIQYLFDSVKICMSKTENDPGSMEFEEMIDCILNPSMVENFVRNKIQKRELK